MVARTRLNITLYVHCLSVLSLITSFRTATKAGLLDIAYSAAWQSARSDGTNRTVYSPRAVPRRNTNPVTVTAVQWQDATPDALQYLQLPAARSTHRTHKSVSEVRTAPTNEPSACLWTHYLTGTCFASPLCRRSHIRNISVGFVITPPDGRSGFRLPSETQ